MRMRWSTRFAVSLVNFPSLLFTLPSLILFLPYYASIFPESTVRLLDLREITTKILRGIFHRLAILTV